MHHQNEMIGIGGISGDENTAMPTSPLSLGRSLPEFQFPKSEEIPLSLLPIPTQAHQQLPFFSPQQPPPPNLGGPSLPFRVDQLPVHRTQACARCHTAKTACDGGTPCSRCARLQRPCLPRTAKSAPKRRRTQRGDAKKGQGGEGREGHEETENSLPAFSSRSKQGSEIKAAGQLALLRGMKDVPLQLIKCSESEIPVAARSHVPTFFLCFEKSLIHVNEAYSQMFGIGCEDIIFGVQRNGFTWLLVSIFHQKSLPTVGSFFFDLLYKGEPFANEVIVGKNAKTNFEFGAVVEGRQVFDTRLQTNSMFLYFTALPGALDLDNTAPGLGRRHH